MNKILKLAGFFSIYSFLFKYHINTITVLFVMLIVDYLTGITNSVLKGDNFNYKKAVDGILKKINYMYVLIASFSFDLVSSNIFSKDIEISKIIIIWLILNEIISTLSNLVNSHILPKNLLSFIKKTKESISGEFKYK